MITPAISVLSALEGVTLKEPALAPYVLPMAVAILVVLFAVQQRGTARIGSAFGPVMLAWVAVIAALGVGGIVRHPGVIAAVDPMLGVRFLGENLGTGAAVLGAVFLAITRAEALYADMGHIGRGSIRLMWYGVVLPEGK